MGENLKKIVICNIVFAAIISVLPLLKISLVPEISYALFFAFGLIASLFFREDNLFSHFKLAAASALVFSFLIRIIPLGLGLIIKNGMFPNFSFILQQFKLFVAAFLLTVVLNLMGGVVGYIIGIFKRSESDYSN